MAESPTEPFLIIHSQYVKDLSFENPRSPAIFGTLAQTAPELAVSIDLDTVHLKERTYEVVLTLRAEAKVQEATAFLVELDYAGTVTIGETVAEKDFDLLLQIETPRLLFPFARSTLAAITRDGGFPPVVINPIDFEQFYRRRKREAEAAQAAAGAASA